MDMSLAVFVIGTVTSFFPIYYLMEKFVKLMERFWASETRPAPSPHRGAFLELLREEARSRVEGALAEAMKSVGRSAAGGVAHGNAGEPTEIKRLAEIRTLMDSLFSKKDVASFDRIMRAMGSRDRLRIDRLEAMISSFKAGLVAKPSPFGKERGWSARVGGRWTFRAPGLAT